MCGMLNASSVDEILEILDKYWNYADYALLQQSVQEFREL